jgi:hypothetical protein
VDLVRAREASRKEKGGRFGNYDDLFSNFAAEEIGGCRLAASRAAGENNAAATIFVILSLWHDKK